MRTKSKPELATRLRDAVARLARRLRQEGAQGDATPSQLTTISTLRRLGPLTLGELAREERVKPPSMTRIVSALEERGLVRKEPDAEDGRVVRVALTDAGRKLNDDYRRRRDEWLCRRLSELDARELDALSKAAAIIDRLAKP